MSFFYTCGNAGDKALKDMDSICGKTPIALLELKIEETKEARFTERVKKYIDEISIVK